MLVSLSIKILRSSYNVIYIVIKLLFYALLLKYEINIVYIVPTRIISVIKYTYFQKEKICCIKKKKNGNGTGNSLLPLY